MSSSRLFRGLTLGALLCGAALLLPYASAELKEPGKFDRDIAQNVCQIMEQYHLTRHSLDDEISMRTHKEFIEMLDPKKMFLLESDARDFAPFEKTHDDLLAKGDLTAAFYIYQRFLSRLDTRSEWAKELAAEKYDFSKPDQIVVDKKAAKYSKTDEEAKERWRSQIKYEVLALMVEGKSEEEARKRVANRYRAMHRNSHQIDNNELLEMYLSSLTNSYDPHSTYMSSDTWKDFEISIQQSLEGIGAVLQSEDGRTKVKEVVKGGAADKDGQLKEGDEIFAVGEGDNGPYIEILDMKLRNVVKHIRGKAGTKVRLKVHPANNLMEEKVYELVRQKIDLEYGSAKGYVVETPKGDDDKSIKVGVIKLPSFYADQEAARNGDPHAKTTTNDCRRFLNEFKEKKVDAVVVDLRYNGGGLLREAIDMTGLFIDAGPIVLVKDSANRVRTYPDEDRGVAWSGPLVVVVNKFSASASEIFAGAIQDYRRGIVVGDSSTHGKGTVQEIHNLDDAVLFKPKDLRMGALKLTMQQFYRVNGDSTQNLGVRSDVVLPSPSDQEDFGEAKLDFALGFDRINRAGFNPMALVTAGMIDKVKQLSMERQQQLPDLVKLQARKAKAQERFARTVLTFTEESLRKEREELTADEKKELDDDNSEFGNKKEEKKFGEDPYTTEVLRITADFVQAGQAHLVAR